MALAKNGGFWTVGIIDLKQARYSAHLAKKMYLYPFQKYFGQL